MLKSLAWIWSRLAASSRSGAVQVRQVDGGPWYLFGRAGGVDGNGESEDEEDSDEDASCTAGGEWCCGLGSLAEIAEARGEEAEESDWEDKFGEDESGTCSSRGWAD